MTVTFATKCWGGDYQKFLAGAFERKRDAIGYPFDIEMLVRNNGVTREVGLPINGPDVYSHQYTAMRLLGLTEMNNYASGEIVAVVFSSDASRFGATDYLCYVQGDALTQGGDWVTPGIKVLESEPDVMVVSPLSEVNTWHDKDGYDHYMSDQAFLVRVKDFMNPEVYHVGGTDPDYPDYGGNSFEHMVGKYLKKTGLKRKILTDFYVQHPTY